MSRIRRFFSFMVFRVIPFFLLLGILWSGYRVAQAVVQQAGDFLLINGRAGAYVQTATSLAVLEAAVNPTQAATALPTQSPTDVPSVTASSTAANTATRTPAPTDTASATMTLTYTAVPAATSTATEAPTITTAASLTPLLEPTASPAVVAQVFATNTPHAEGQGDSTLVTNTPAVSPTPIPTIVPTFTETPAPSLTPTSTLTPTSPPVPTATLTPQALPTLLRAADPSLAAAGGTAVPTSVSAVDRHGYDLVNILLMGGDAQVTNDNTIRTDTMIILSINRTTNTVAMLSLPRDLYVYIPSGTMQRLNTAYGIGENIGWTDGGWGLLRQTIFYNLGINVHFYALVDFSGFASIIDTVGGVDVSVDCAIEDLPLIGAQVPQAAHKVGTQGYNVLDVGYYHLTGPEALWYARSRYNSSDFDRGRRQQQILRAIWRKARDTGQLAKLPELWNEGLKIIKTNLGFNDMLGLLPIALNLDPAHIESFTMIRTYHTIPWQTPTGDFVQLPNYDNIRPLLEDFYQPPTDSQIQLGGASIMVRNGTPNKDWDRVAADRLAWDGYRATASGAADKTDYPDTILIDHTGQEKGSSRNAIAKTLNVKPENIQIAPDPNRQADFEVILGANYNSCSEGGVLPVDQGETITVTPAP